MAENDLDGAEQHFAEAARLAPNLFTAHLGSAEVAARRGDLVAALAAARRGARLAPQSAEAAMFVVRLLAQLGSVGEALAELERARSLAPEDPTAYLLGAVLLRDAGRAEEAVDLLSAAWRDGVRAQSVAEDRCFLLLSLDRPDAALAASQEGLLLWPESGALHLAKGLAQAADTEARATALESFDQALALGTSRPGRAHLEKAIVLLELGRPEDALKSLRHAEELLPESPEVYYRLGTALRLTGDRESAKEALATFQKLRQAEDAGGAEAKRLGTDLNRALTLADAGKLSESLALVDEILAADPGNDRVLAARGKVLFSLGRAEEAHAAAVQARELNPGRSEHHYLEGLYLLNLDRFAEAEATLRRALALDPELGEAYTLLGGCLAKQNRAAEAAAAFERALALGIDTPALRLGYAAALESLGRAEESAEQMAAYRRLTRP